jgi:hypothetical protein
VRCGANVGDAFPLVLGRAWVRVVAADAASTAVSYRRRGDHLGLARPARGQRDDRRRGGGSGDGGQADPYHNRERGQVQGQEVPSGVQEELPRRQDW